MHLHLIRFSYHDIRLLTSISCCCHYKLDRTILSIITTLYKVNSQCSTGLSSITPCSNGVNTPQNTIHISIDTRILKAQSKINSQRRLNGDLLVTSIRNNLHSIHREAGIHTHLTNRQTKSSQRSQRAREIPRIIIWLRMALLIGKTNGPSVAISTLDLCITSSIICTRESKLSSGRRRHTNSKGCSSTEITIVTIIQNSISRSIISTH